MSALSRIHLERQSSPETSLAENKFFTLSLSTLNILRLLLTLSTSFFKDMVNSLSISGPNYHLFQWSVLVRLARDFTKIKEQFLLKYPPNLDCKIRLLIFSPTKVSASVTFVGLSLTRLIRLYLRACHQGLSILILLTSYSFLD